MVWWAATWTRGARWSGGQRLGLEVLDGLVGSDLDEDLPEHLVDESKEACCKLSAQGGLQHKCGQDKN